MRVFRDTSDNSIIKVNKIGYVRTRFPSGEWRNNDSMLPAVLQSVKLGHFVEISFSEYVKQCNEKV